MAVPKLRFRTFNTNYINTKFENLKGFSIQSGNSEDKETTGCFPFYGSTGIIGYKDTYGYEGNSILIARVGANAGSLYQVNGKYSVSDNTLKLTISEDNVNLDYLRELLIKFNLNKLVFGTGQPLVTGGLIKKINVFIPDLLEQTKIATFLSAVDEKIAQLSQKLHLLGQYKQGMMQKLFSQEFRFKADDGSEFGEWEETTLEKIGTFLKGKGISKADIVCDGQIPCVRYGELYTHYGEVISKVISATNIDVNNLVLSKANDVLIPASGETQIDIATASCILNHGIALSGDLNIFRTKENGIFLSYLIRSKLKMKIAQLAQGNSVVHLYATQLKGVELNLPCLEEQTKIANFLSAIDQKMDVVSKQLKQAKTWKKGLLQQMFV